MTPRPLSAFLARLLWLCLAPMALFAVWMAWSHVQEQHEKHLREGANLAHNVAWSNDRFLDARIKALNMLAISPLADDPRRWPELYREAQGFHASFGTHVIFADEQRQMLFNTRQPYGTALPHLPLSKGRSAAPQVGDIVLGPVANIPLVVLAVPVLREGRPTRLMLSTIETRQFQERLEQLALPAGWSIALQDGTGADIARRSPPGFDSAGDVDADHRFVVPLELSAWSVVLEIPRSSHRDMYREAILSLGVQLLLALGLGLVGGMLASRRISRQVAMLAAPASSDMPDLDIAEIADTRRRLDTAAAELMATHQRLQLWSEAFLKAEVGVVIGDARNNTFAAVNTAFSRQRGYAEDELVGQPILSVFSASQRDDLRARWPVLDATGHAVFESEHQRKDGSCFPVLVDITVLRDADGRPLNRVAFVLDITDRKQAEQMLAEARLAALNRMEDANAARREVERQSTALQESQARLRLLVDHAPLAMALFDHEMHYLAVSQSWQNFFGIPGRDVIGQSHYAVFPDLREEWKDAHRRGLAGEVVGPVEDPFTCSDGTTIWTRWEVRPWRVPDGGIGGIVIFAEDITATHAAREALAAAFEEQKAAHHAALNLMEDAQAAQRVAEQANRALQDSEADLRARNEVLERLNRATAGREVRMIALKQQVNALARQLGQPQPYPLDFLKDDGTPSVDSPPQE